MSRPVLIATTNPAKQERILSLLEGWEVPILFLNSFPHIPPPEETGADHLENALLKARYWSESSGGRALASDGGMVIPALSTVWDSLTTHRAAGDVQSDEERLAHLVALMDERTEARKAKDFDRADAIRDELTAEGWTIEDTPKGPRLKRL